MTALYEKLGISENRVEELSKISYKIFSSSSDSAELIKKLSKLFNNHKITNIEKTFVIFMRGVLMEREDSYNNVSYDLKDA